MVAWECPINPREEASGSPEDEVFRDNERPEVSRTTRSRGSSPLSRRGRHRPGGPAGTLFAAAGWTVLEFLFRYYVGLSSVGERYGVVGTVLLLITWLYFSGFVLLVGAALNAVLAGRSADVSELGWGENRDAKERARFTEPLERIKQAFDAGEPVTVRIGSDEFDLPPPDRHEAKVSAPNRPDSLGGETVDGSLILRWVYGRSVGEGKSEEREVPNDGRD